jgi:dihydropyrimidine dehydrogenase (NAD+) subunit PreA
MADLSVNFAGLKLENPFIVASSELTNTVEKIKIAEDHGASAAITKLCFLKVPFWAKPYHIVEKRAGFFSPSGDRLDVEQAQKLIDESKKATKLKIIANMMGPGEDLEGWAKLARMLEDAGADMIEMNMSCPNVGLMAKQMNIEAPPELGASLGQNPALAGEVSRIVAEAVKIPVMAKMTPEAQTAIVAEACARNGVAAVSAINCPQSLPSVDIYEGGRPIYPNSRNHSFAGLCGPWIRPLAYRHVAQIAMRNPGLAIAGGGGLAHWSHCVDMLMYGATVLTFCTILYLKGFKVIPEFRNKLEEYMDQVGYKNLEDFRGAALKYIVTPDKVDYRDMVPKIDADKCNHCGICTDIGHCQVFKMEGDTVPKVDRPKECYGCGVCYFLCPRKAISLVDLKTKEVIEMPRP